MRDTRPSSRAGGRARGVILSLNEPRVRSGMSGRKLLRRIGPAACATDRREHAGTYAAIDKQVTDMAYNYIQRGRHATVFC